MPETGAFELDVDGADGEIVSGTFEDDEGGVWWCETAEDGDAVVVGSWVGRDVFTVSCKVNTVAGDDVGVDSGRCVVAPSE